MSDYAIYRLPNANEVIRITGETIKINNLKEISEQQGYLVAPFNISRHPILLITPHEITQEPIQCNQATPTLKDFNTITESPYIQAFSTFHKAVASGPFHKLVLSRAIKVGSIGIQQPEHLFMKACTRYPHQMVTLFSTEQSGTWLIITPEILLTSSNGIYRTMALAGTMPAYNNEKWSEKNRQEQRIVSDYINLTLAPFASDMRLTGPYSTKAGGVQHLRTDFEFVVKKGINIGNVLDALHPTPAVCGLPKHESMQFIINNEGYDREYYSGFSGPLNIERSTDLYVTLRCGRIEDQYVTLYAGGGIMPESEQQSEDLETQLKMQTIKDIL